MAALTVPNIVKHCCIAIYREGKVSAKSLKDRFKQCFRIARSRMAEYGFVVLAGEKLSDPIGLTPKGRFAEQRHKREGRSKSVLFDALYVQFDIDGTKEAAAKKEQEGKAEKTAEKQQATKNEKATDKSASKTAADKTAEDKAAAAKASKAARAAARRKRA